MLYIEWKQNECLTVLIKALIKFYVCDETHVMGGTRFTCEQAREEVYYSHVFLYTNKHTNNSQVSRSYLQKSMECIRVWCMRVSS